MRRFSMLLVATTSLASVVAQQTLVLPSGYANTEGNGGNSWPWNQYASWPYLQMQEIYDSTNFTNQGVAGPIRITQLRYRADSNPGSWAGGIWPAVRIDMPGAC